MELSNLYGVLLKSYQTGFSNVMIFPFFGVIVGLFLIIVFLLSMLVFINLIFLDSFVIGLL